MHSHYNPNYHLFIEVKIETNKIKILWWRIKEKIEDWSYEVKDFIDYIKRYRSSN